MFKCLLFFVLLVIHVESRGLCRCYEPEGGQPQVNVTEAKAKLDRGSIALCGEFLYQLTQKMPDDNFVTSPFSLMNPLALITLFATPPALQQLLTLFNLDSKDEIKAVYKEETAGYKEQSQVVFEEASEYFLNKYYTLSAEFESDSEIFDAGGQNVDFGDPEDAADIINDWVANHTNNTITDLVSADSLGPSTVMVLCNAVYFNGNWIHPFNPDNTQKQDFTKRNNDVVQVDMMYQQSTFNYAENNDLNIQVLEMLYKGGNFSCLIILPDPSRYDDTIQALRDPDVFQNIMDSLSPEQVQVSLPKVLTNTNMNMREMLQKDNVTEIFNCNKNSFEGMLDDDTPLCVSDIVQKAFISIDETGTEAAAATAIGIMSAAVMMMPTQIYVFNANVPYLFYVLYEGVPMFCGSFVGAE